MKINLENKYNILIPKIFYNNQILYEGNEKNNNRHLFIMDKENPCPAGPYKIDAVFNIFETYPSKEFAPERGVLYLVTITYDYVEKILDFSIIPNIEFRPDEIIEHIERHDPREEITSTRIFGEDVVKYVRKMYHGGFLMKDLAPEPLINIDDVYWLIKHNGKVTDANEFPNEFPTINCKEIFEETSEGSKKSYIQVINNNIYIRSFFCYKVINELICYEFSRIQVSNNLELTFFIRKLNGNWRNAGFNMTPSNMCLNIVGHDDISETCLKYFDLDKYLLYRIKYPAIDNALKMGLTKLISYIAGFSSERVDSVLCRMFGDVDLKAKSFGKMIGVPSHILPFLNENKRFVKAVKYLKLVLSTETFKSLDPNSMKKIIESTYSLIGIINENDQIIIADILRFLIEKKGIQNLTEYIEYLSYLKVRTFYYSLYMDYLRMCDYLGNHYEWKVNDIYTEHENIRQIYNLLSNEEIKEKLGKSFDEVKPSWDKYLYEGEKLVVIAPASIDDIIDEGIALHHCVKSYINAVCEKTTNILFIRKKEDIQTPFFTMEIRGDYIRQCHGLCNCDMDDEVKKFLSKYAVDKKLNVNWSNGALCV